MNNDKTLLMANGQPAGDEIMNKPAEKFERFQREEKIHDVEFKTEAVSYIKDVWRRFKRDKVTVTATFIILIIVFMAIIGPGISKFDYLSQNLELKNMPPRIPVLEDIGIMDGTRVLTVHVSNLDNYAYCIVKELDRFTTSSSLGKS